MGDQIEQMWSLASTLRAQLSDSRLGFRLEELMIELKAYFAEEEIGARG